jgi:hypothetical protein
MQRTSAVQQLAKTTQLISAAQQLAGTLQALRIAEEQLLQRPS